MANEKKPGDVDVKAPVIIPSGPSLRADYDPNPFFGFFNFFHRQNKEDRK